MWRKREGGGREEGGREGKERGVQRKGEEERGGKDKTPNRWCLALVDIQGLSRPAGPASISIFIPSHCLLFYPIEPGEGFLLVLQHASLLPFGPCTQYAPTWNVLPPGIHRACSPCLFRPLLGDLNITTLSISTHPPILL